MGLSLASNDRKARIGHDPRNTAWANDTSRFGHQYMLRQGWKPGRGLGSSVEGITTHVKVKTRPEGKGLGFSGGQDLPTGLDDFQRLLGRLNGEEEKVDNQLLERKRRQVGLHLNFVPGGVLEGTIEQFISDKAKKSESESKSKSKSKSKEKDDSSSSRKRSKVSKDSNSERKKRLKTKEDKKEKRSKKEEEKLKKAENKKEKETKKEKEVTPQESSDASQNDVEEGRKEEGRGIQATRRKYIAMKRRATADPQSLKEILMR